MVRRPPPRHRGHSGNRRMLRGNGTPFAQAGGQVTRRSFPRGPEASKSPQGRRVAVLGLEVPPSRRHVLSSCQHILGRQVAAARAPRAATRLARMKSAPNRRSASILCARQRSRTSKPLELVPEPVAGRRQIPASSSSRPSDPDAAPISVPVPPEIRADGLSG